MIDILSNILDLSKIEAMGQETLNAPFSLADSVQANIALFSGLAKSKKLTLGSHIAPEIDVNVLGDAELLRRTLSNLIGNAIKFTRQGQVIVALKLVSENSTEQQIEFSVTDTGIGVDPELQEEIFKPFKQANEGTTREFGGTGLGLSIVKGLVELQGGTIELESSVEQGSCFRFVLTYPRSEPQPTHPQAPAEPFGVKGEPLAVGEVLIVEDDNVNQMVLQRALANQGLTFDVANNGVEAFTWATKKQFDLILMDLLMPKMDGFQTTELIRNDSQSLNQQTPIIALTAKVGPEDRQLCLERGMNEFVGKPVDLDHLTKLIRTYLT